MSALVFCFRKSHCMNFTKVSGRDWHKLLMKQISKMVTETEQVACLSDLSRSTKTKLSRRVINSSFFISGVYVKKKRVALHPIDYYFNSNKQ